MGDLSEYRGLIVVGSFVAVAVLLMGLMIAESPGLFTAADPGTSPIGDSVTSPSSLIMWNETTAMNFTVFDLPVDIGGWNVHFRQLGPGMDARTIDGWGPFVWGWHNFKWYSSSNELKSQTYHWWPNPDTDIIYYTTMDADYNNHGFPGISYELRNDQTKFKLNFAFNTTLYTLPSLAAAANALSAVVNMQFDDRNTSINVVSFIAGLFVFGLPGFDPTMIWIIRIPIILALAYIAFIAVLRIIGAVFGGGGA